MRILCWLLLIPIMALASPTSVDIRECIHKFGSKAFTTKITADDWAQIIKKISAGDDEWLSLVPELAPVINFEQSNQLSRALYYALDTNAKRALKIMSVRDKRHYKYQQGTDISYVPPFDKITDGEMQTYHRIRLSLLDAGPQAANCLWIMEGWVEEIKADEARKSN